MLPFKNGVVIKENTDNSVLKCELRARSYAATKMLGRIEA